MSDDTTEELQVFVITPIGNDGSPQRTRADELLSLVIDPALDAYNDLHDDQPRLKSVRADKISNSGSITVDIVKHIVESRFVIADATGGNLNVFYELGIADSFGKPTVRFTDDTGSLPFDVQDHRTFTLANTEDGHLLGVDAQDACGLLLSAIDPIMAPGFTPTSVVAMAAAQANLADFVSTAASTGDSTQAINAIAKQLEALQSQMSDLRSEVARPSRAPAPPRRYRVAPGAFERAIELCSTGTAGLSPETAEHFAAIRDALPASPISEPSMRRAAQELGLPPSTLNYALRSIGRWDDKSDDGDLVKAASRLASDMERHGIETLAQIGS